MYIFFSDSHDTPTHPLQSFRFSVTPQLPHLSEPVILFLLQFLMRRTSKIKTMRDNANANAISNIESRTDFYIQLA